jgi:toxin ParE1/3/4
MTWQLSRAADEDFVEIYRGSVAQFGVAQAEAYSAGLTRIFDFLADFPRAARERVDIDPPVRAHPFKAHIVVYVLRGDDILIVRIRHGHEDWQSDPL